MNTRKNILVLTSWSYKDGLIQAYTLPYLYIINKQLPPGSFIYLVTLEKKSGKLATINSKEKEEIRRRLQSQNIKWIAFRYRKFNFISIFYFITEWLFLVSLILTKRIKFIHALCTPAGAFGYLLSLFTGRRLIIDSYEPHAEAMAESGTWRRSGLQFKILFYLEKKLSHHADTLIGATEKMIEYADEKYGAIQSPRFFYKPACVDVKLFSHKKNDLLAAQLGLAGKIVCVYAGKFGGFYLTNEVFDFFKTAEEYWGDRFRALLLTPHKEEELYNMSRERGFDSQKMVVRFVDHSQIAEYIKLGTFGITPFKPIPTRRFCTPVKDAEYWAAGLPIVITKNISDDSDIIESNNIGAVIQEFSTKGYLDAIKKIDELIKGESPESLSNRIVAVAKKYRNFSIAEEVYKKIYG